MPDLPEGFTLDEGAPPEGFTLDPLTHQQTSAHPLNAFGNGMIRGGWEAVNPLNVAKALYALGKMGVRAAKPPMPGQPYEGAKVGEEIASGLKETVAAGLAQRGPEAMGEVWGGALAGALPAGDILAGVSRKGVPVLGGATEASRAYNIKRALRIPTGTSERALKIGADIEQMAPEITLPVTKSPEKLAKALQVARRQTGAEVSAAEAALPARDIPVANITARIPAPEGKWSLKPTPRFTPFDPEAYARYRASVEQLDALGTDLTTSEAIGAKRAAQAAGKTKGAYLTKEAKGAADAAKVRASAIRSTLEALPGPEAEAFTAANRRHQVARTVEKPASVEAARLRSLPLATRSSEMLLGRGFTQNPSILGAIGGVVTGNLLDSRLFHTASAAIKRSVIDALKTGNPQLATDILFKSAVAKTTLDRRAAAALTAQGEGVTSP